MSETIATGAWGKVAWYVTWGRAGVWQQGKWAVEVHFPYIRWGRHRSQIMVCADSAMRLNWKEKALAVQVLGFGIAGTLDPQRYSYSRNNGRCWHGVPLNRQCSECHEWNESRRRA